MFFFLLMDISLTCIFCRLSVWWAMAAKHDCMVWRFRTTPLRLAMLTSENTRASAWPPSRQLELLTLHSQRNGYTRVTILISKKDDTRLDYEMLQNPDCQKLVQMFRVWTSFNSFEHNRFGCHSLLLSLLSISWTCCNDTLETKCSM